MKSYTDISHTELTHAKTYKSEFYKAEQALIQYKYPVTLFGTRRTGKTTVLRQLWSKYSTSKSKYVRVHKFANCDDIFNLFKECADNGCDLLCLDEITNTEGLDYYLGEFVDYCLDIGSPLKIVMAGTNSYLLEIARHDSACDRLNVINFNPPKWKDYNRIMGTSFSEFMLGINCFYIERDYIKDIASDLYNAMEHISNPKQAPSADVSSDTIEYMLRIIVENMFSEKEDIPRQQLIFRRHHYLSLTENLKIRGNIANSALKYIINALKDINIFTFNTVYSLSGEEDSERVYVNTPLLFRGLLDKYDIETRLREDKEGHIFEVVAFTQIYASLKELNIPLAIGTLKDTDIEYDMILINHSTYCAFFIDFKRSANKTMKYINDIRVITKFYNYKCKFYTIYLLGVSNNPNKLSIEYFLTHLNSIPGLVQRRQ